MSEPYTFLPDLADAVTYPGDGILSKPVFTNDRMRAARFAMSAGQELTEHTTTMEALLQFLESEADISLSGDAYKVGPGAWMRMEPNLKHTIKALTSLNKMPIVLRKRKPGAG